MSRILHLIEVADTTTKQKRRRKEYTFEELY